MGATSGPGLPLCLAGFGHNSQRTDKDRCCAHVGQGSTRGPEGIQLEADCFLSSLPLHTWGEQRSGRASRFGQQLCLEKRLSARHLLIAGGLNSWMGWKLVM